MWITRWRWNSQFWGVCGLGSGSLDSNQSSTGNSCKKVSFISGHNHARSFPSMEQNINAIKEIYQETLWHGRKFVSVTNLITCKVYGPHRSRIPASSFRRRPLEAPREISSVDHWRVSIFAGEESAAVCRTPWFASARLPATLAALFSADLWVFYQSGFNLTVFCDEDEYVGIKQVIRVTRKL